VEKITQKKCKLISEFSRDYNFIPISYPTNTNPTLEKNNVEVKDLKGGLIYL